MLPAPLLMPPVPVPLPVFPVELPVFTVEPARPRGVVSNPLTQSLDCARLCGRDLKILAV